MNSNLSYAVSYNKRYTLLLENISLYFVLQMVLELVTSRIYFFLLPMPHSILSFLNATLLHCNVFLQSLYTINQTSNWLLLG
jgi:hypothetical protein